MKISRDALVPNAELSGLMAGVSDFARNIGDALVARGLAGEVRVEPIDVASLASRHELSTRLGDDVGATWFVTTAGLDRPRTLWRIDGALTGMLLHRLGVQTDADVLARPPLEVELSLLDGLVLRALDRFCGGVTEAPATMLVQSHTAMGSPLTLFSRRERVLHVRLECALLTNSAGEFAASEDTAEGNGQTCRSGRIDVLVPRAEVTAWARCAHLDAERWQMRWAQGWRALGIDTSWSVALGAIEASRETLRALEIGSVCMPKRPLRRSEGGLTGACLVHRGLDGDDARPIPSDLDVSLDACIPVRVVLPGSADTSAAGGRFALRVDPAAAFASADSASRRDPRELQDRQVLEFHRVQLDRRDRHSFATEPMPTRAPTPTMPERDADRGDTPSMSSLDAALAEAPVTVRLELGRVALTPDALADLRVGGTVETQLPVGGPIALRIGNRCIAHGELVEIEGQIGIRITALAGAASEANETTKSDGGGGQ